MYVTRENEEVKNAIEQYDSLITEASLLCKEYIKLLGHDYGYSVYDIRVSKDTIYFKYRHYDGVFALEDTKIPTSYLSNKNWKEEATKDIESNKNLYQEYNNLRNIHKPEVMVPQFAVSEYLKNESEEQKQQRLRYVELRKKFETNRHSTYLTLNDAELKVHPAWR